jgi:cyclic beta-1,2-glucan synthetase
MGKSRQIIPQPNISREAMRDFICASSVIFIIGAAMYIYFLGERGGEIGGAIVAALAGAAIAEWSKFGLSGRHLTVSEFLQDVFVSGFIAVSSCPAVLLKPPAAWSDLLFMNSTVAAIVLAIYHASNLYHLAALRQHLSKTFGIAIIAPPYLIGWLLLLESPSLLQSTWLPATESLGRVLVVFLFNEAVVNGLGMAMRRVYRISMKAHLLLLGVAITAVAGPWIAQIGSSGPISGWPLAARGVVAVLTTLLSQAGLWAEVYLITGIFLEALYGKTPSRSSLFAASFQGVKKGMIYSGIFMGILHGANLLWHIPLLETLMDGYSFSIAALFGAATFPLAKTIIETFDGSHGFFRRVQMSYRDLALYLRGAVIGLGLDYAIFHSMAEEDVSVRVKFGLAVGIAAFAGVSLLRDSTHALRHHERLKWRAYLLEMIWGGLIGAAIGFYLDAAQLAIVAEKFQRYVSLSHMPEPFGVYPFLSKWGFIRLGNVTGGVSLLFNEALAGVICWSVPAWLFALNRTFLTAAFRRETTPMKLLFTHAGFVGVTHNMLEVLRWGLWMSPIINSFLRPMGEPTWYNQDGAIHTLAAIFQNATSSPEDFRAWSLHVFILLLAYDSVRILIWLDHMGLRVATLVNLSFLGMDKLDERLTRFLGSNFSSRCIPESVKRFATWAPLLIPYYIPRGKDWDIAWSRSEALQKAAGNGNLASSLSALPLLWQFMLGVVAILSCTALFAFVRWLRRRFKNPLNSTWELRNSAYSLSLHANGEIIGQSQENGYDLSRRCYDFLDPAGRALFVVDVQQDPHDPARAWPALGNFPSRYGKMPQIEFRQDSLVFRHAKHGIATTVEISLPDEAESAELWTITLENTTNAQRQLKVVPYLEWVLNRPDADRNHTQYNRLFAELEYCEEAHAILARDKHSNALGVLAADVSPQGFLTSRIDFIGRARNLWQPRILETLAFMPPEDEPSHPTFDPLGSLLLDATLRAGQSARFRLLMGMAKDKRQAIELISRTLGITCAKTEVEARSRKSLCAIRHGEIPAGIPQPYWSYSEDGRALLVHTPFTPRPFDHTLSNSLGHTVSVTNRGLHTSCNGNSQQNLLTPNWTDIVTREVPGEAFYLYDIDSREWYSPTFHPLNDAKADYQAEFRIDGTAIFRMTQATLATELTVFVPPQEPLGVYLLTV